MIGKRFLGMTNVYCECTGAQTGHTMPPYDLVCADQHDAGYEERLISVKCAETARTDLYTAPEIHTFLKLTSVPPVPHNRVSESAPVSPGYIMPEQKY